MLEFAILLHVRRTSENKHLNRFYKSAELVSNIAEAVANSASEDLLRIEKSAPLVNMSIRKKKRKFVHNSHRIDKVAFVIFGMLFCAFNSVYWVYYLLF